MGMGKLRMTRRDLPERMYCKHGAYYFVDLKNKWHNLGRDWHDAIYKYADINSAERPCVTLGKIMDDYQTKVIPTKAVKTQRDNLRALGLLRVVFGHMQPDDVEPKDVYGYMAKRPPVAGNREKALLSHVFTFAIRQGLTNDNPCRLVVRNTERPRDRYVTDGEYSAVHKIMPAQIQCAMEIALLTGLRENEILRLKRADELEDGLLVKPSKRGKPLLFELTPELKDAIKHARSLPGDIKSMWLIHNRQGQPYTTDGFRANWQRHMKKALEDKIIGERFTFHDLRAKAGSDHVSGDILGHQDPRTMNRVYRRKPRKVTPGRPRILDK